jgi:hypothetical protein
MSCVLLRLSLVTSHDEAQILGLAAIGAAVTVFGDPHWPVRSASLASARVLIS